MTSRTPSVFSFVDDPRPAYLLRLEPVARFLASVSPRDFVEVGSGRGDLAAWLAARGFHGILVEPAPGAVESLRRRFAGRDPIRIHPGTLETLPEIEPAGLIIICEVLEHLADDAGLLREAARRSAPGGLLVGSVPAHPRLFGASDRLAGHLRRYERETLAARLVDAGWQPIEIQGTGFPLGRLVRPLGEWAARRRLRFAASSSAARTAGSGMQRLFPFAISGAWVAPWMAPAFWAQRWSGTTDLGTGFFFAARRR
jgi:SAM-dependent methyltransferase